MLRCFDAQCTHLYARRSTLGADASMLGARASTLGARTSTLDASTLGACTSTLDASALDTWRIDASTLDASALRRLVHAPRRLTLQRSTLGASTPRRSVHAPRRSTLRRFDAWCTHLDASALDAWRINASTLGARTSTLRLTLRRCTSTLDASALGARTSTLGARTSTLGARTSTLDASALDAWRIDASTLGARTSTLDASALRRLVHAPRRFGTRRLVHQRLDARCMHLDARRLAHRRLDARCTHLDARCTHLDARRFGASTLGACTSTLRRSTLGASTPRHSVHAPRRSTLRRFDARCTHLDARRFGARRIDASTLSARTTMSGFHRCVTCQAKLPASDPHNDCMLCLGPDHAASALADRAYCQLCAGFQTRTLRQRARKAVGGHSLSSGSSHTISAPPSSAFTPPVAAQPPRSPSSQLSAGQRSPARRTRERSRSPSSRGARPRRESRSRSRSPRRRRYSRSPRRGRRHQETSGVAELTSKMSQFMEVMMGQQSLLMTLANVVPRAPELPTGPVAGQPVVPPPVPHGQPKEVWDVDAVSRDTSNAEPLFEEGTEPEVTSQHSEQDDPEVLDTNDPMWSVVERAARHLGVDWPASEPTRCSLFELPSAQPLQSRILPAFPDFIKEVQSTWGAPASTPQTSRKAAAFNMHVASEAGLALFPPVCTAFAALVKVPTLSGLAKDPSCPNKQCRIMEAHLKKGYAVATEADRLSNVASLLTLYQAALLRDLPECPSAALRTELGAVAQLLVKLAQLNARAQGRSIASLVVARRQLWLSQARVQEPDKVPLLDAPISPGHTFGPAVEEMLQRSVKAREASQQLAKMWPSKPFQPRRPQERQWRRAPPQQQAQSRGSMTAPSGVSACGQPAFGSGVASATYRFVFFIVTVLKVRSTAAFDTGSVNMVRRRRHRRKKTWEEEEWCTHCMQYGHEEHHCLEVLQDTDLEWEEPERPVPEWEEPEHPAPEWEEPERPQCLCGRSQCIHSPRGGSRCVHSPKGGSQCIHSPRGGRLNVHNPGIRQQRENTCWCHLLRRGRTVCRSHLASRGRVPAGSASTSVGGRLATPTSTSRGRVPACSASSTATSRGSMPTSSSAAAAPRARGGGAAVPRARGGGAAVPRAGRGGAMLFLRVGRLRLLFLRVRRSRLHHQRCHQRCSCWRVQVHCQCSLALKVRGPCH
ncbi:UNVERIFIED_CONTAM: hypothetical protein FKN15_003225 [Acipenser sinensis]